MRLQARLRQCGRWASSAVADVAAEVAEADQRVPLSVWALQTLACLGHQRPLLWWQQHSS